MRPEEAEVRRWVEYAHGDWSAARKLFASDNPELEIVAFHCQQAIEKLLKAYLVSRGIESGKIHDLGRLLQRCTRLDTAFADLRDDVDPLTQYAVVARYPGPPPPSVEAVRIALAVVETVWNVLRPRLPPEAVV